MSPHRIRSAKDGTLLEAGFQDQVVALARFGGWAVAHMPANRPGQRTGRPQAVVGDTTGFPDLILLRGVELLAVELKTDKGRLGPGQQDWLDRFEHLGNALAELVGVLCAVSEVDERTAPTVEAYLWRPRDWEAVEMRLIGAVSGMSVAA